MTGFTSVSLRRCSIEEVADTAFRAGAEIIEWGGDRHVKTLADAEKAKRLCDERGITVNSYGSYYRTGTCDGEEWKKICEITASMGAKYIRAWLGGRGSAKTGKTEYSRLVEDARSMADTAGGYGLTVSHECHPGTYNDTAESCLEFIADCGRDNIKTYFQSWYRDERGDLEKLEKTFPYISDVHLSFSEMKKYQLFHKKDPDFIIKILSRLKQLGFDGGLIIEFTGKSSPENLIKDIERLKKIWQSV